MTTPMRLLLLAAVMISCVGCDQTSKHVAAKELKARPPASFLGNTVLLSYAENPGGFLSLGADLPAALRSTLFVVLTSSIVLGLIGFAVAIRSLDLVRVLCLGLVAGGGIGNLIDRIALGSARDFIVLRIGPIQTGVFNGADAAIMLGVLVLFAAFMRRPHSGNRSPH